MTTTEREKELVRKLCGCSMQHILNYYYNVSRQRELFTTTFYMQVLQVTELYSLLCIELMTINI